MRRLPTLTRRQATTAAGACLLCAAVTAAALTGNVGLALTLLAVFFTILFAGLLLIARRLSGLQRAQRRHQDDVRAVLDQTQRRVLGAIEELLLHSGDRHREMAGTLAHQLRAQTREVEALVQLFQQVTPRAPMPPVTDGATLLDVLHLIRTRRPRRVLELGGASAVWIAYALEQTGGKLLTLDHDAAGAERTRAALAAHGLTEVAEVREAPLRPIAVEDRTSAWYDLESLADVHDVDLLVVGGPPETTGPDARYPALRLLEDRLAEAAAVFVLGEPDVLGRWLEKTEGLTREGEALVSYRRVVRQLSRSQ
ncbi:class I SAM-dependent methyltransferase [Actinoplanes sp. URMC 104]|uniref:class I SAM-dependent methyltransferase n=1 Tax=Actinoplanes sp. URMC 104 TaxID=3423409 RepID=UPI003F19D83E